MEMKSFLFAPKTRWHQLHKVCLRYLLLEIPLEKTYKEYANSHEDADTGSKSIGRLKQIRNVYVLYSAHLIADGINPLQSCAYRNQDTHTLSCEYIENLEQLQARLSALKETEGGGEYENRLWERVRLDTKRFLQQEEEMQIEVVGSPDQIKINLLTQRKQAILPKLD